MKTFQCDRCGNLIYFENDLCLGCKSPVGFNPEKISLITLQEKAGVLANISDQKDQFRYCDNHRQGVCNWLIANDSTNPFCVACSLNGTIPALGDPENVEKWKKLEIAKHRLIYSLLVLNLPFQPKVDQEDDGLQFDFLNDIPTQSKILTGHNKGVITINVAEADEIERVSNLVQLREKYRTLLGHFRHEVGHYYWDRLIKDSDLLEPFRNIFGDETIDYAASLKKHYEQDAASNWSNNFISPYATAHPWEDWAESWSHYLHMMDTLETAHSFGITIHNKAQKSVEANIRKDPYSCHNFDEIMAMWLPLTFAVNSLNRSMGHADFYPFIITPPVIEKLKFIHRVCESSPRREKMPFIEAPF